MGLMDLFGKKSPLFDTNANLSNASGKLTGAPSSGPEGDFHARFVPDDKRILQNRNQVANPSGLLDLKIKVMPSGAQAFLQAVLAMREKPVSVTGVVVNDDSQGGRVEIHPLDMIHAPESPDQYPEWFKAIQANLKDPGAVAVYKIAAATDASRSSKPPRSEESRAVSAFFPYPPKPNFPKIKLDFEVRASLNQKADFKLSNNPIKQRVELDLGIETIKEDGPGVFIGDMVIYWGNE